MRDWETGAPFYSSYAIGLQWDGRAWRIREFEM